MGHTPRDISNPCKRKRRHKDTKQFSSEHLMSTYDVQHYPKCHTDKSKLKQIRSPQGLEPCRGRRWVERQQADKSNYSDGGNDGGGKREGGGKRTLSIYWFLQQVKFSEKGSTRSPSCRVANVVRAEFLTISIQMRDRGMSVLSCYIRIPK